MLVDDEREQVLALGPLEEREGRLLHLRLHLPDHLVGELRVERVAHEHAGEVEAALLRVQAGDAQAVELLDDLASESGFGTSPS